jgi:hypothetical protein
MTIQELLDCDDPSKLESLTDEELKAWFEPFFNITRPELAKRQGFSEANHRVFVDPRMEAGLRRAKELGIDLGSIASDLRKRKR